MGDRLVDAGRARVDVLDHGFTVGDGVFETMRTLRGPDGRLAAFALDRHVARLIRSATGLGLTAPDAARVRDAVGHVCSRNPELGEGARVRITLSSGPGPVGSDRGGDEQTLVVTAAPAVAWPATTALAISPWPRNERSPLVGLKTTSYAENVVALARAKGLGAGEALLANLAGNICEGTGSNVFLGVSGRVVTPTLASGCLAGITRELVLEWAPAAGVDAVEEDLPLSALPMVDEIFLTSSTRDVHPVLAVLDERGRPVWSVEEVGPLTAGVRRTFGERSRQDVNP